MAFRKLLVLLLATAGMIRAQAPLNPPVPLAPAPVAMSPGTAAETLSAARRAQELGFDTIAAIHYRKLLEAPGPDRAAVALALATVLLDDGDATGADQVLQSSPGPHGAAWHLRAALAAALQKKASVTRSEFDATKPAELSKEDTPWFSFLQGMLTQLEEPNQAGQGKANTFYQQALDTATTEIAKARFQLAVELTRLRLSPTVPETSLEQVRLNMESNRGRAVGYDFARIYVVMLETAGRKARAVEVLQDLLRRLPATEAARVDDFRFLLGLIGGAADGAGRNALIQLLEKGSNVEKQRAALQLLARASQAGTARTQFRAELDRLVMATPPSNVLPEVYLFRAMVTLAAKNYAQAEEDARAVFEKFPGSPLLPHAFGILTSSAWEQRRFRLAADYAAKAQEGLQAGSSRAELGVIVAEAWFRAGQAARAGGASGAGDFRLAAEAYAEALREPPPGMSAADLMYQRVLAEIEAGSPDAAERLLDEMTREVPDPINRWQAEWNLARAMQAEGKSAEALARVTQLLGGKGPDTLALPAALRVRMAWLQAQLSFDVERSEQTLKLIDNLGPALEGVDPALRTEIASWTALLKAQTLLALKRNDEGLATLVQLRKDFPKSGAAIYSYMTEANLYAAQQKSSDAQRLLTKLAEDFPDSEYAPWALFRAAEQAEARGQEESYKEAVRRIEDLITLLEKYPPKTPANDLIFAARFKEGDLLRKLNQFPQAREAYQSLLNKFPQREDIALAYLALAESYNAESASDPSNAENARALFEQVLVKLDAPVDARVEAGYNYGELFVARGEPAKALEVWWRDVVHAFLDDPAVAATLGTTGRYWMGRTLTRIGDILEREKKLEEAKKAWELIVRAKLWGEAAAREQLERYNVVPEGKL